MVAKLVSRGRGRTAGMVLPALIAMLALAAEGAVAQREAKGGSAAETSRAGTIVGRIVGADSGEGLVNAQVFLAGGGATLSGLEGRYLLQDVPEGAHEVRVELLGYAAKSVTGVAVSRGEVARLDITLERHAVDVEGITVTATVERGNAAALTNERRRASGLMDAVGRDQMARTPDGDAGAVLKRVPGLSVVDDRYAYVRGLGERYSGTSLNGAPLASPVPDKNVIPLDLFPSQLLESVVTRKSYSPENPGDYAGGLVELRTRDFPAGRELKVSLSSGFNSASTFRTGLGYEGGGLDFLGFDDGTRALPDVIPADRRVQYGSSFSRSELQEIGREFAGDWGPTARRLRPPRSLGLTFGDDLELFGRRLGVLGSLSWSDGESQRTGQVERVFAASGLDEPEIDYRGRSATREVQLGGLFNASVRLGPEDEIGLDLVYSRLTEDEARIFEGFNLDSNTDQRNTRVQYLAQSMSNAQLRGRHRFPGLGDLHLTWRGAYTRAGRYEPNTREVLYRRAENGDFVFDTFIQSGSVFHQDLDDRGGSGEVTVEVPFRLGDVDVSLKTGASGDRKDRDVHTRRFRFLPAPGGRIDDETRTLSPNELFSPEHIGRDGFEIQEATFRADNYTARDERRAAFALLDGRPLSWLRVAGGARIERTEQRVDPHDIGEVPQDPLPGARLRSTDVLPSLNVTADLGEDVHLRVGGSRTIARPQLRELAPFGFADYAGGHLVVGNPHLELTRIRNLDVRAEWYVGANALVAASLFHKTFDAPIEVVVLPSSELLKSWVNADEADNYGVELEMRTSLGFVADGLDPLSLDLNLTLVESEVATGDRARVYVPGLGSDEVAVVDSRRPLQGQSPYVVNAGLTWAGGGTGTSASVLYHRFGRRIGAVGGQGSGDQYEEARGQLDLVVEQSLGAGASLKLSAVRLLGNVVAYTQEGDVLRRYDRGRTISLSVGWELGG